jgi:hypothetical protein
VRIQANKHLVDNTKLLTESGRIESDSIHKTRFGESCKRRVGEKEEEETKGESVIKSRR